MIAIVAAIVAATAAGVLAERRWGGRAGAAARAGLVLSLYVLIPPVVFFNIAALEVDVDLGAGVALGWLAIALAATVAWAMATRVLRLERPAVGAVVNCTLLANTGYLGYPLVVALLGSERLGAAVVYDIAVAVPALLLVGFAVGAAFGTKAGETAGERVRAFFTRNPPLLAGVAGLVAPDALAPDALVDASRILVVALLPLGFFAVGAALEEEAEEGDLRVPPPLTRPVALIVATRLALAPALLFALAAPLIELPGPYLLLAAMPCGINTMVVAHAYGLDLRITAEAVAWTTVIAIVGAVAATLAL